MINNINLLHGDCLEKLKKLDNNSIDSLVTDPPAGISFMGKEWDSDKGGRDGWIDWMSEIMRECLRVMKPGAHGLVWAIPRTSHWTATALENAGFEVRDVVTHLFGSGFPKSLDISKAIDKAAGAEREVIGFSINSYPDSGRKDMHRKGGGKVFDQGNGINQSVVTAPSTDSAKQWQGWGTALKPAVEKWVLVRKPKLTVVDCEPLNELECALWLKLNVLSAEKLLKLINAGLTREKVNIVPDHALTKAVDAAEALTVIGEGASSLDQMDISALDKETITFLSIVWSWKIILVETYNQLSTFITETEINRIIDYQTLNCLVLQITQENITQENRSQNGLSENVLLVESYLRDLSQRCYAIQMLYAPESALLVQSQQSEQQRLMQKIENVTQRGTLSNEIILIRKPCSEKTVAKNVLKHGTGGINIDASRIEAKDAPEIPVYSNNAKSMHVGILNGGKVSKAEPRTTSASSQGRFPANLVFSHSENCTDDQCDIECAILQLDEQSIANGIHSAGKARPGKVLPTASFGILNSGTVVERENGTRRNDGDKIGASRFFYCAKISTSERNAGLEDMPDIKQDIGNLGINKPEGREARGRSSDQTTVKNHHPTVKPKKLMSYFINMITPPNGIVLDPFMGSGSTGIAAKECGFDFVGIEKELEYFYIAKMRILGVETEQKQQELKLVQNV